MKTIKFWFYDPPKGSDCITWVDRGIRLASQKIHVEGQFENGRSFSSTMRKDIAGSSGKSHGGVRFKDIDYSKHPERWVCIQVQFTDEQYYDIYLRCLVIDAMQIRYDLRGAVGCFLTGFQSKNKLFCSEAWFALLAIHFALPELNVKQHPDALFKFIKQIKSSQDLLRQV